MTVHSLRDTRPLVFLLAAVLALAMTVASSHAAEAQQQPVFDVTGELEDGGTFEGTVSNLQTFVEDGVLMVSGFLEGTATDAEGNVTEIAQDFTATLSAAVEGGDQRRCQILFLDIGPIFLDLLGLQVDISPIEIDITAVPGPGNLLGNLLCAVAGLLDGPDQTVNALSRLLNRVLGLLG